MGIGGMILTELPQEDKCKSGGGLSTHLRVPKRTTQSQKLMEDITLVQNFFVLNKAQEIKINWVCDVMYLLYYVSEYNQKSKMDNLDFKTNN